MADQIWLESPTLADIIDFIKNYPLHTTLTTFLENEDAFAFFWGLVSFALTASVHDNQLPHHLQWVKEIKRIAATAQITTPEPRVTLKHSATQASSITIHRSQASQGATSIASSASSGQSTTPHHNFTLENANSANSLASNSTQASTYVPDTIADSEGGPLWEEFAQWSGDPSSFWDQSAKPLRLTQATYMERFRAFLAQALKEGSQLHIQVMLTQPANLDTFRSFRMHTLKEVSQFQMQIYQYRFTCVLAYQFWMRFSSSLRSNKFYKLTSPRIKELLRMAGLPLDNERVCSDILFGGRRRYEFCKQLQPNRRDVDYSPLFRSDIPDAIWDRPTPYARKKFDDYIEISKSKNVSRWSEESGAQSAAKAIIDSRQALIWPEGVHLWINQPQNYVLSQQRQLSSLLSTVRKRQRTISPTIIAAPSALRDPEIEFIQYSGPLQHTEYGLSSTAWQNPLNPEDAHGREPIGNLNNSSNSNLVENLNIYMANLENLMQAKAQSGSLGVDINGYEGGFSMDNMDFQCPTRK